MPRIVLFLLSMLCLSPTVKAQRTCGCGASDYEGRPAVNCDTRQLKGGYSLYYRYDCRRVWLTLQKGAWKKVIFEDDTRTVNLTYRLGYQPRGDFNRYTLFRYGCPANGPCEYVLLRKRDGRKIRSYDYRDLIGDPQDLDMPCILYFDDSREYICIDYMAAARKVIRIKVNESHFGMYSDYSWKSITLKNDVLRMTYKRTDDSSSKLLTHRIRVDLRPYLR